MFPGLPVQVFSAQKSRPPQASGLQEPQVFCPPPSTVRPLPGLLSPGLTSTAPSAPYMPPTRSSVSWAHEPRVSPLGPGSTQHVPTSLPRVQHSLPWCPGFPRPSARLLPGFVSPGLMSTAPSAPCQPPASSPVSWAHGLRPQPPVRPSGLMSTAPPAGSSVSWAYVDCTLSPLYAPCQVFCLLGS